MAPTAADVLIETLQHWGVKVVFGLPGDGINGIMEAHGLYDAALDGQPVLAITSG